MTNCRLISLTEERSDLSLRRTLSMLVSRTETNNLFLPSDWLFKLHSFFLNGFPIHLLLPQKCLHSVSLLRWSILVERLKNLLLWAGKLSNLMIYLEFLDANPINREWISRVKGIKAGDLENMLLSFLTPKSRLLIHHSSLCSAWVNCSLPKNEFTSELKREGSRAMSWSDD